MKSGIYSITHIESGRAYIGSSRNILRRWNVHRSELNKKTHHSPYLQNVWNKYGESSFMFEIIELCDIAELIIRENFWFQMKRDVLLNTNLRASSGFSGKHSQESRKKMSMVWTEERRQQQAQKVKNRLITEATLEKWRLSSSGRKHSEETKRKIGSVHKGKKNSVFNIAATKEANSKKVRYTKTGQIFNSFTEAGKSLGCSRVTIRNRLGKDFEEVSSDSAG